MPSISGRGTSFAWRQAGGACTLAACLLDSGSLWRSCSGGSSVLFLSKCGFVKAALRPALLLSQVLHGHRSFIGCYGSGPACLKILASVHISHRRLCADNSHRHGENLCPHIRSCPWPACVEFTPAASVLRHDVASQVDSVSVACLCSLQRNLLISTVSGRSGSTHDKLLEAKRM